MNAKEFIQKNFIKWERLDGYSYILRQDVERAMEEYHKAKVNDVDVEKLFKGQCWRDQFVYGVSKFKEQLDVQ